MTSLAPEACRAGRAILKWSTEDLTTHSGVAGTTISRLENGGAARASTSRKLIAAFAAAGVEILPAQSRFDTHFGHATYFTASGEDDDWRFVDTDEPLTPESMAKRRCPSCKLPPTDEGFDPCIGHLPGVEYACCGHGLSEGYVKFQNGTVVRGWFSRAERDSVTIPISEVNRPGARLLPEARPWPTGPAMPREG